MTVASRVVEPIRPDELMELRVDLLTIGDDFRLDDDLDDLADLTASIKEHGVLQPLLVRQTVNGWEVAAGRRRLAAARNAGRETVPCLIKIMTDEEAADAALAENLHRRNLSPIEEALAYERFKEQGQNQAAIARRVGRSQSHVSMLLRLLKLPPKVRAAVHEGKLSYATALRPRPATGKRQGGASDTPLRADEGAIVSHWRRRHDRLLSGLHVLQRARPESLADFREMVGKLIRLDAKPLKEVQPQIGDSRRIAQ
jgi:ParB/RepB/Spo0J family partition protein